MKENSIFVITGAPGAGKTTLATELLQCFERGVHIPVDDLRLWVRSGLHDAVPWTDETERQFQIAEAAACAVARTYQDAGFAVVIDHCRILSRLNQMVDEHLAARDVRRILLLPNLAATLSRNAARTNKDFDTRVLEGTISGIHQHYSGNTTDGWTVLDTTQDSVAESVFRILS